MRNKKGQFMKGHRHSPEIEKKRLKSIKKIIYTPERIEYARQLGYKNKGVKNTWSKPPHKKGKESSHWKGSKISYRGLHTRIRSILGIPKKCENKFCVYPRLNKSGIVLLEPKRYEWANKSRKYKQDIKDWIQLCNSCHRIYDLNMLIFDLNGDIIKFEVS